MSDSNNPFTADKIITSNEEMDALFGIKDGDEKKADTVAKGIVCSPGQIVVKQGTPSFHAYYVEYGRAEVLFEENGETLVIGEIGPGEVFGEMGALDFVPRGASVRALEKCKFIPITKQDLQLRLDNIEDKIVRSIINALVGRLRDANRKQFLHYKKFTELQDRLGSMMLNAENSVPLSERDAFTEEVLAALDQLDKVVEKYKNKR